MDNFRGFKDTYLPLKDVNFFVGENSTGKTSVMALIQILQSRVFWENLDFQDDSKEINLGSAEEICDTSKIVRIGIHESQLNNISQMRGHKVIHRDYIAILIGIQAQSNGSFQIKDLHFRTQAIEVGILSINDEYKYQIEKNINDNNNHESAEEIFETWINQIQQYPESDSTYKSLDIYKQIGDPEAIRRFKRGAFSEILQNLAMNSLWKKDRVWEGKENNGILPGQLYPIFFPDRILFSPLRTKPEPMYGRVISGYSSSGEHTPYLLKQLQESGEYTNLFSQISNFGRDSGLFNEVTIEVISSNIFQVLVNIGGNKRLITNVGYGISQVLPLLVEILFREAGVMFLIQQPEVHLHPRAQSAMGEFIYNQAITDEKKFIIETHSDFLVDRYRLTMRKSDKKVETQVVYFEHTGNGNTIHFLPIDDQGRYPEDQPPGFTEFFINEAIAMMEV